MLGGGAAPRGLAPLLFANLSLLMAKEKLGTERAVVASALASGQANNRFLAGFLPRKSPKVPRGLLDSHGSWSSSAFPESHGRGACTA